MAMKIKVTEKDIKEGVKFSAKMCPVSLALRRNGVKRPRVYVGHIQHGPRDDWTVTWNPYKVEQFILKFDSGKKVKPFKFVFNEDE